MCKHHWMIGADNRGVCKLCSESRDFASINMKVFLDGASLSERGLTMEKNLCMTGGWYMQGGFHRGYAFGANSWNINNEVD